MSGRFDHSVTNNFEELYNLNCGHLESYSISITTLSLLSTMITMECGISIWSVQSHKTFPL